jgi:Uma2 family endonuclease
MSTQPKAFITPEQYLEIERKAAFRSEYYRGEMFAMAGAQRAHILLVTNVVRELSQQVRQRPCQIFSNDLRVNIPKYGFYTYPDVVGVCGEARFLDNQFDTLLNPNLIVEILSPSTEAYDRGRKFEQYRAIDSLSEYLMVGSDRMHVELYTRKPEGWVLSDANLPESVIELASIGCSLKLADVYEKVEFDAAASN